MRNYRFPISIVFLLILPRLVSATPILEIQGRAAAQELWGMLSLDGAAFEALASPGGHAPDGHPLRGDPIPSLPAPEATTAIYCGTGLLLVCTALKRSRPKRRLRVRERRAHSSPT